MDKLISKKQQLPLEHKTTIIKQPLILLLQTTIKQYHNQNKHPQVIKPARLLLKNYQVLITIEPSNLSQARNKG